MADKPLPDLEQLFRRSLEKGLSPEVLAKVQADSVTNEKLSHPLVLRGMSEHLLTQIAHPERK